MLSQSKFDFFCRAVEDFGVQHVVLLQDGRERYRRDWIPEERQLQYSISKSFTGTAVGFALEEGLLHMTDPVISFFEPDELPREISPELAALQVRHLLTMQMGHGVPYLMGSQRRTMKETDWVSFVLSRPMKERPGIYFTYSNAGPYLAGVIIERLTGGFLVDYLMPRLFEPLEIPRPDWDTDPLGHTFGAGGLHLSVSEVARFGQLYLQMGKWNGEQILPRKWVRRVWDTDITTEEGQSGYSLLFWRGRYDSISAVGRYGQYCTMIPGKNAVVVINSMDEQDDNLLEYVWTYLYPSL